MGQTHLFLMRLPEGKVDQASDPSFAIPTFDTFLALLPQPSLRTHLLQEIE